MPTPIICFGDSIFSSFSFPEIVRWPTQLQAALDADFPEQFEVYNRGVGGDTTTGAIARFQGHVSPWLPGIVLIEFGFNDASVPGPSLLARCPRDSFKLQLAEIVRMVRAEKGSPILIVNHPIRQRRDGALQFNGKPYIENYAGYSEDVRDVARKTETPVIDLERSMTEDGTDLDVLLSAEDGLHLTRAGNAIYAGHILRGLRPHLPSP